MVLVAQAFQPVLAQAKQSWPDGGHPQGWKGCETATPGCSFKRAGEGACSTFPRSFSR